MRSRIEKPDSERTSQVSSACIPSSFDLLRGGGSRGSGAFTEDTRVFVRPPSPALALAVVVASGLVVAWAAAFLLFLEFAAFGPRRRFGEGLAAVQELTSARFGHHRFVFLQFGVEPVLQIGAAQAHFLPFLAFLAQLAMQALVVRVRRLQIFLQTGFLKFVVGSTF